MILIDFFSLKRHNIERSPFCEVKLMSFFDMVTIGACLAMDASAVACANGMSSAKSRLVIALVTALSFGFFQGFMPIIGYFAGSVFTETLSFMANWIALALLSVVGIGMIRESLSNECEVCKPFSFKLLLVQSIATSLDALAVGVSFAVVKANIFLAALVISVTTALISFIAFMMGCRCGSLFSDKAELAGGIVLILIGFKIALF